MGLVSCSNRRGAHKLYLSGARTCCSTLPSLLFCTEYAASRRRPFNTTCQRLNRRDFVLFSLVDLDGKCSNSPSHIRCFSLAPLWRIDTQHRRGPGDNSQQAGTNYLFTSNNVLETNFFDKPLRRRWNRRFLCTIHCKNFDVFCCRRTYRPLIYLDVIKILLPCT